MNLYLEVITWPGISSLWLDTCLACCDYTIFSGMQSLMTMQYYTRFPKYIIQVYRSMNWDADKTCE